MRVLVVNAGSSSLKVRLLDGDEVIESWHAASWDAGSRDAASWGTLAKASDVDAVGHRVVHGGTEFVEPVVIDDAVERRLRALIELAPLHQPKSLDALDAARAMLPDVPHVACFDTAFHATMPAEASTYALPAEWRARGLRRFGFHGLSHEWAAGRTRRMTGARRIVTCHLGAGASLAAVLDGRCVDTTMGFTPLEGLVMATRSGSVDPGLVLWLQEHEHVSESEIADALEYRSGLLGLAGTADMREILHRAGDGDDTARLALEVYLHRLCAGIAAMTASLGGLDALVFTGGVGENAAEVRQRATERLSFLGVCVDEARNRTATPDADVSTDAARVPTLVVAAREDLSIAHATADVLSR